MGVKPPNLVFILPDQVRAAALPHYGGRDLPLPNIGRLAEDGMVVDNVISTAPVCTPYRSMLMTGRHPLTTGHVINFLRTRNDEIGLGDVFSRAGYRTGYIGKWHLHTGSFPEIGGRDYVPTGRDRLGFDYWRGYNFHQDYFNGSVNLDDWRTERWDGYETDALAGYARQFLNSTPSKQPFCLFVSPHQCHRTPNRVVPEHYRQLVPEDPELPANVPRHLREAAGVMYRDYLAMLVAVDDMVGRILDDLTATGRADETIVIFTSDHGTQGGAHGYEPWEKRLPFEESIHVPWIMRWPGVIAPRSRRDVLLSPVDILPSLSRLCGLPIPRTVEGRDLSRALLGEPDATQQEAVLTMNFSKTHDFLVDGAEWRGVRTRHHTYARWRDGTRVLFDNVADPLQQVNLVEADTILAKQLEEVLGDLLRQRNDDFRACTGYADWFDTNRRVIANAYGPLGHPEDGPDWSLAS